MDQQERNYVKTPFKTEYLPFALIGSLGSLRQLGGGGSQALLRTLQILLQQLDATVQGGNLGLGLSRGQLQAENPTVRLTSIQFNEDSIPSYCVADRPYSLTQIVHEQLMR